MNFATNFATQFETQFETNFVTNFVMNHVTNFFDEICDEFCDNFFYFSEDFFLTYNLLTIASFRVGVHLILFCSRTHPKTFQWESKAKHCRNVLGCVL